VRQPRRGIQQTGQPGWLILSDLQPLDPEPNFLPVESASAGSQSRPTLLVAAGEIVRFDSLIRNSSCPCSAPDGCWHLDPTAPISPDLIMEPTISSFAIKDSRVVFQPGWIDEW
jgi:hypothetical protein